MNTKHLAVMRCTLTIMISQVLSRTRLFVAKLICYSAIYLSRLLYRGQGGMIGGLLALKIDPEIIAKLTRDKKVVLVTGTNGKSTTTRFTAEAIRAQYRVCTQSNGANMDAGIATSLITSKHFDVAVLEVDEMYLPKIAEYTNPDIVILLNITRDQLDRYGELTTIMSAFSRVISTYPDTFFIANCDDVLVTSAAFSSHAVQWYSANTTWHEDSILCPRTNGYICRNDEGHWFSTGDMNFARPTPQWFYQEGLLHHGPQQYPLHLSVPGKINYGNAVAAIAAADLLNVDIRKAISRVCAVDDISGRYKKFVYKTCTITLLLAKNPAGWKEALLSLPHDQEYSLFIGLEANVQDGKDTSWLWDVSFDNLHQSSGRRNPIYCLGSRSLDVLVRLNYEDIDSQQIHNLEEGVKLNPNTSIYFIGNYSAFTNAYEYLTTH